MRFGYGKSWATYYNFEVAIALAFRLNTYETSRIRQKALGNLCKKGIYNYVLYSNGINSFHKIENLYQLI